MAPSTVLNLPPGYVFEPKGRVLIEHYLVPMALRGATIPGYVAEGVDVFTASPDALPFQPSHRREHGEAWGYFFAAQPAGERALAPGGCWLQYGAEKEYRVGNGGEAVAFRRRFRFYVRTWEGFDGTEIWAQTPWLMKEYRLNKGAAAYRSVPPDRRANMNCVVLKVFTKPVVPPPLPPPPPARSSEEESTGSNCPIADEDAGYSGEQARKRTRFS